MATNTLSYQAKAIIVRLHREGHRVEMKPKGNHYVTTFYHYSKSDIFAREEGVDLEDSFWNAYYVFGMNTRCW